MKNHTEKELRTFAAYVHGFLTVAAEKWNGLPVEETAELLDAAAWRFVRDQEEGKTWAKEDSDEFLRGMAAGQEYFS